jgi:hypothetical protein
MPVTLIGLPLSMLAVAIRLRGSTATSRRRKRNRDVLLESRTIRAGTSRLIALFAYYGNEPNRDGSCQNLAGVP